MRKGILVVSFGTSHLDTMEKTIDVLEKEIAEMFKEAAVYRAFTSNMIIKKLRRTADIQIDPVKKALERMAADGIEEVIVIGLLRLLYVFELYVSCYYFFVIMILFSSALTSIVSP